LVGVSLLLSFLAMTKIDHWIARVWEFPRIQIIVLALLGIILCYFNATKSVDYLFYLATGTGLLVTAYQLFWIIPYSPFWNKEVEALSAASNEEPSCTLSLLSANVLMNNRKSESLFRQINTLKPDITVLLESDSWWQQQADKSLVDYPYRVKVPKDNLYGMHVYSRIPLTDVQVNYVIKSDIPSITCKVVVDNLPPINCFFVHPEPPSPTESSTAKPRDKELIHYAKRVRANGDAPVVVCGDLNDVAWSPTTIRFKTISGLRDPRVGRGFINTFHADHWWARWPLDHIFVSNHFLVKEMKRLSHIGSDHFPLYIKLWVRNSYVTDN
jgi:endonuclease/exonuclease/phosphatase (EEP) superfamily protein YafD